MVDKKNGTRNVLPWVLGVLLLAAWTVSLAVLRPTVVFPGVPRRIGQDMWAGIPVLLACILLVAFGVRTWQTRDERKLGRLIHARLLDEGNDPKQIRKRERQELEQQAPEREQRATEREQRAAGLEQQAAGLEQQAGRLKEEAAGLRRSVRALAAENRKKEVQNKIREEERKREERKREKVVPESPREPAGT